MANYVSNKVLCSKSFFDKYFLDSYSLGEESYEYCHKNKYISFNKLFGVKDVNEYYEKYGEYIYYGFIYEIKEISDEFVEVKFKTKRYYPIKAIIKAIEIDHNVVWNCVEENVIYISRFSWKQNGIIEETLNIENDEFYDWYNNCNIKDASLVDNTIWYYESKNNEWIIWKCNDLIARYKDNYPSNEYYEWIKSQ